MAALALATFRRSRDPQALFVGAGFLVLAAQEAIFGIWWPLVHDLGRVLRRHGGHERRDRRRPPRSSRLPSTRGSRAGSSRPISSCWHTRGETGAVSPPRAPRRSWDRPRSSPPRWTSSSTGSSAASALSGGEAVPDLSSLRGDTGAVGVILGVAGALLLLVAAERMWRTQVHATTAEEMAGGLLRPRDPARVRRREGADAGDRTTSSPPTSSLPSWPRSRSSGSCSPSDPRTHGCVARRIARRRSWVAARRSPR